MEQPEVSIQGGWTSEEDASLTVTRGPTTFIISLRFSDVQHTHWGRQYLQGVGRLPSDLLYDYKASSDMIISLCLPLIRELAPICTIQGLSVEALCSSPTYRLKLVDPHHGQDGDIRVERPATVSHEASHNLWPIPVHELPKSCESIPWVPASSVILATAEGNPDPRATEVPQGKVRMADGGAVWLKPCFGEVQFKREVTILSRIMELHSSGSLANCRIPRLLGLVVTGGKAMEVVVGMLIEIVSPSPDGIDLLSEALWKWTDLHERWRAQVVATVKALHDNDIVWGDVNAGNVVIDNEWNAWVIDFGGLNNPEFVDDELAETSEGDWQGVDRLFGTWLPSRTAPQSEAYMPASLPNNTL